MNESNSHVNYKKKKKTEGKCHVAIKHSNH